VSKVLGWAWTIVLAPLRAIRWCWRKATVETLVKIALISMTLFVLVTGYTIRLQRQAADVQREVSAANRDILRAIEQQTSPEAQQRQADLIDLVIDRVDCRNQASLQRTIDVLVERGVLRPGEVRAITDACAEQTASGD
jgi:hypothetical protein